MSYDYSENILVQESAGDLLHNELGWDVKFAYNTEVLGENGTFGRKSYKEILLVRYFRDALKKLNPWITYSQILEAQTVLEKRLSTSSLLQINEEKYYLIRDGIPVTVKHPDGRIESKKAAVIGFTAALCFDRHTLLSVITFQACSTGRPQGAFRLLPEVLL